MKLFTALLCCGRALASAAAAADDTGRALSARPVVLGGSMSAFCSDQRL